MNLISSRTQHVSTIPIAYNGGNPVHHVAYSVHVPNLAPSDIVLLDGQFEVTNDVGVIVGVGRYICRASQPGLTLASGAVPVWPPVMENVDPSEHHQAPHVSARDTGVTGGAYYNLVLYAVSGWISAPADLRLEDGYGILSAAVLRAQ